MATERQRSVLARRAPRPGWAAPHSHRRQPQYVRWVPDGLVIAGGALQAIGITMIFVELAAIRSKEFDMPTPWRRAATWLRRLIRRPRSIQVEAALATESSVAGRVPVRPGPLKAGATEVERIERLERYVALIDNDLGAAHTTIDRKAVAVLAEAERRDDEVRAEIDRRDAERKQALRPSLLRQGIGGMCAFVGTVMATVGSVV